MLLSVFQSQCDNYYSSSKYKYSKPFLVLFFLGLFGAPSQLVVFEIVEQLVELVVFVESIFGRLHLLLAAGLCLQFVVCLLAHRANLLHRHFVRLRFYVLFTDVRVAHHLDRVYPLCWVPTQTLANEIQGVSWTVCDNC